ncbi:MAG: histidine--tRNA ligase [Alphaproteobacteria bacterium]|nr:histidine--tRNA ligase [Alphaproteobacteria bacterium]MBT5389733.1 histidine--tRNA ligase [Alphaproteobacteria bacterium]MBT5541002.1 histidine--tRNA ligase [Alphaproteobacteria bacterium]MBT5654531.1 histidine--tRNA ligase [Alphaproteobacteria bacterium]
MRPVRGTHDLLPDQARKYRFLTETALRIAETYGFDEISTPILEFESVFKRTLGETSDIVSKEMFTIVSRGDGETMVLRPEGTAPIIRAIYNEKLLQEVPLKYFYHGPMFRYERPQKGRLRQFHQFGVESIGHTSPCSEVEVIATAHDILKSLGIGDKTQLEINSLGDPESREAYRAALVAYLRDFKGKLSPDSQERLERNPLRILDSKSPEDKEILKNAPTFDEYMNIASKDLFQQVLDRLQVLEIPYVLNHHLVRGLDYYCHTTFEFTTDALGAQGALIAGGRYDGLHDFMGGTPMPSIGWAGGIDRMTLLMEQAHAKQSPIAVIPIGDAEEKIALSLAHKFRKAGLYAELILQGNLGKRMKKANKLNASCAVLLGEDEVANQSVLLRDFQSGTQETLSMDAIVGYLQDKADRKS